MTVTIAERRALLYTAGRAIYHHTGKIIKGYIITPTVGAIAKQETLPMSNYEDPRDPGDPPEISPIVVLGCAALMLFALVGLAVYAIWYFM